MAKHNIEHLAATYAIAERFVDSCLRRDGSLFTPGRPIWTLEHLNELDRLYVQAPDPGEGGFEDKLKIQIGAGSDGAIQLAAEILFVYYLPASTNNVAGNTKRSRIDEVLSWMRSPVEVPADVAGTLDRGIGGVGVGFHTYKWASFSYFITIGRLWKELAGEERVAALSDPWRFMDFVDQTDTGGGTYAREALLHLVHPDTFERIFSRGEKLTVAERFASLVGMESRVVDIRLNEIRQNLALRFGPEFDFYWDVPIVAMWKPSQNRWASFVYWASRFRGDSAFEADERSYKIELAGMLEQARRALAEDFDGWPDLLKKALRSRHNNLLDFRVTDDLLSWISSDPNAATEALRSIWQEGAEPALALQGLFGYLPAERQLRGAGARAAVGSVLLMATDPIRFPPYRPTPLQLAYKLTDFGPSAEEPVARYEQALSFFDEVVARANAQGVDLRDRLDAQSVTWCIATYDPPEEWPAEDRAAFLWYRQHAGSPPPELTDEPVPPGVGEGPIEYGRPTTPLATLANDLLIDEEALTEIANLLETKRQLVFYGPPGTGKTFVAKKLAGVLTGDESRVRIVQFHPSYAYEDFVEGYRPRVSDTGQATFELVPGPLRRIAADAAADSAHLHILIIDEMNRANVSKVLGELYFLLEYRDEPIELQYSAERFVMPTNLRIIGTMNTADRSIALLDAALRRRFGFIPFFPDQPPIQGLLRRWLGRNRPEMAWVADVVDAANERLADRNGAIGPSFFLVADLDDARLGLIWKHEIMPYLEDHFFGEPERLAQFEADRLRASLTAGETGVLTEVSADDAAPAG